MEKESNIDSIEDVYVSFTKIFSYLSNYQIKNFYIDKDNPYYYIKDNCLYDKSNNDFLSLLDTNKEYDNFIIPEGTKRIGAGAFAFSRMKNISVPDSVTTIDAEAFGECIYLNEIELPPKIKILDLTFRLCMSLTNIILPSTIESIVRDTFMYCKSLTSITFPSSVKTIGDGAFFSTGLTSITIPESVTSIESGAFGHNTDLTEVTFEGKNCKINKDSFNECDSLKTIKFAFTEDEFLNAYPTKESFIETFSKATTIYLAGVEYKDIDIIWQK